MTPEEYLEDRVEGLIAWYDEKSRLNKQGFVVFQIFTLIASAAIPVLSLFWRDMWARLIVAVLGSATAVTTGIVALYQFREHWIEYRTTAESLKHEKYMFQTKTGPYSADDAFPMLVDRVEALASEENTPGHQRLKTRQDEKGRTTDAACQGSAKQEAGSG